MGTDLDALRDGTLVEKLRLVAGGKQPSFDRHGCDMGTLVDAELAALDEGTGLAPAGRALLALLDAPALTVESLPRCTVADAAALVAMRVADVAAYLQAHGWEQRPDSWPLASFWYAPSPRGGELEITLPCRDGLRDHADRMADVLQAVGEQEDRSQLAVYLEIVGPAKLLAPYTNAEGEPACCICGDPFSDGDMYTAPHCTACHWQEPVPAPLQGRCKCGRFRLTPLNWRCNILCCNLRDDCHECQEDADNQQYCIIGCDREKAILWSQEWDGDAPEACPWCGSLLDSETGEATPHPAYRAKPEEASTDAGNAPLPG